MKKMILSLLSLCILYSVAFAEFVGISKEEFYGHYRGQKEMLWCWASSAEMVLSYQGIELPQEMLVLKAKGAFVNQTGSYIDMLKITNDIFEANGSKYVISGQYVIGAPLPTVLYNQLKQKKPVILTYQNNLIGHAVVLTGIDATVTRSGVFINKLYVFDPFPYIQTYDSTGYHFKIDENLRYKEYIPFQNQTGGVFIPSGQITGVILMNGSKLQK